jgi:CubicO group peptidase (beta-lactamase class C family)
MANEFPLPDSDPGDLGLDPRPLFNLERLILQHIEEGRYPGCQIAIARHGNLGLFRTYGTARTAPAVPATDDTIFLVFSQTKVLVMAAMWALVEEGRLSFSDRVAEHLPAFAARGKSEITIHEVATHQAGFPNATVSLESWSDHAKLAAEVCDFSLEWTPGTKLQYHPRSAHIVLAMVIEAVTGQDYRTVIREKVIAPLGLGNDIFVGVPEAQQARCADIYPAPNEYGDNSPAFRAAGVPYGGGFATARGIAAFYQMLLGKGRLGGLRLFSPRLVSYVTRDFTGDRPDEFMGGIPMHRGLGPHARGLSDRTRGLGLLASPGTFGHGGVGSSYSWGDPESGVSFTYITNGVSPDPWHSARLDRVSNLVHAAID